MNSKQVTKVLFLSLFFTVLALEPLSAQGLRKIRSTSTNSKFKPHKKSISRRPLNYLNSIQLTAGIGPTVYYGELCDGGDCFRHLRFGVGLGAQYRFNELMTVRAEFNYMRLYGTDEGTVNEGRNLSFRSNNVEFSTVLVGEFFRYNKIYRRRRMFTPYYVIGVGVLYFNAQGQDPLDDSWVSLRQFKTEGVDYSPFTVVVPYGLGLRMKVNPSLNLSLEVSNRMTFTDYMDDVSNTYAIQSDLSEQGQRMSDKVVNKNPSTDLSGERRGNPTANDGYFIMSLKAAYTIKVTRQHYNINSNPSRYRILKSVKKRR